MQGRKPKPTEVRVREGNPGKRPLPDPVAVGGRPKEIPDPPDGLDEDAKDLWREAIPAIWEIGVMDTIDMPALEIMCTAYGRVVQARRIIAKQGVLSRGSTGQLTEHPALATERASMSLFLKYAEHFALTPIARTRLGLAQLDAQNALEQFQSKRERTPVG